MKRFFSWLNVVIPLLVLSVACGKSPPPPPAALAPASGDPHATEQLAMEQGAPDLSNLLIIRLQSAGRRVEVTSVLPAVISETTVSGQAAKTIFRVNERGNGIVLFSRDLPHGKSFRTELSLQDLQQKGSFSFPVVQADASLKERSFALEKIIRQP